MKDIAEAQHSANRYLTQFAPQYGKGQTLANFFVPGVKLSDLEMELKYAIVESNAEEQLPTISEHEFKGLLTTIAEQSAKAAITSAVYAWKDVTEAGTVDSDTHRRLQGIDEKLRRDFSGFLEARIFEALTKISAQSIVSTSGMDDVQLLNTIMDVVDTQLLKHPELSFLSAPENESKRKDTQTIIKNFLRAHLKKACKDFMALPRPIPPRLEVLISSEALAKMAPEHIHTLRFKIAPTTSRMVQVELDGVISEQIVPTDS